MNWTNVDLKNDYERNQDFLDGYDFDTLLMEIQHNIKDINADNVLDHVNKVLQNRTREAKEIIEDNLSNILKEAIEYRNME
jgi:uncharacterized protein YfeS